LRGPSEARANLKEALSMSSVRYCVVPAAGLGTRFLPATKSVPKEMLPIVDTPTIQYIVEEAVAAGVEEVVLIQGRYKWAIEDHFDISFELERPLGLGHAVLCAATIVGDQPFAVALGDDLIDGKVPGIKQLVDCYERHKKGVVALMKVPESQTHLYGIAAGERLSEREIRVERMVEKPKSSPPSNLAVIGRYVLPGKVFELLRKTKPGVGGEIQLTDALAELARTDGLIGFEFEGERHDAGDRLGYLKANIAYSLKRPELREGLIEFMKSVVAAEKP
jgi:UTP--glucose-1-phosphate uridylyltransferase